MSGTVETAVDNVIKFGTVFAQVSSLHGYWQDVDTFQFNPIAGAVFSVASVTFEVCACNLSSSGPEVTFDHLAIEGAIQIRPNAGESSRSFAADFAFGKQGRR